MQSKTITLGTITLAALLLLLASCNRGADIPEVGTELVVSDTAAKRTLADYRAAPVTGPTKEGESFPSPTYVAGRANVPDCSECHRRGTVAKDPQTSPEDRASHWKVRLNHAEGMTCRTCHVPDQPSRLVALSANVDVDQAYLSCQTCHKNVLSDWRGGAHGKRLTGWVEPRVIQNCAGCHNPHDPALKKRLPVAHPTIIPERLRKSTPPESPQEIHASEPHGDWK